jgi:predicted nuclease of predicted toxin-antitoxin system
VSAKFLFDENLSPRLVALLADLYPASTHVEDVGLISAMDDAIWAHAAAHGLAIVTKDDDFRQHSFLRGHPPKVIWLRFGNCSTQIIAAALRERAAAIEAFVAAATPSLLVLSRLA